MKASLLLGTTIFLSCMVSFAHAQSRPITLYTYEIPGLINEVNERPFGVAVTTMEQLFERAGYKVKAQLHPFARVKYSVNKYQDSCGFPVHYSPHHQQLNYLLPLMKVTTHLYSLSSEPHTLDEIAQGFVVSLIEHSENDQLEKMGLDVLYVSNLTTALNLLIAGRVDYLVLDDITASAVTMHKAETSAKLQLYPVFSMGHNTAFLVCNNNLAELSQVEIERAFIEILTDGSLRQLWQSHGRKKMFDALFGQSGQKWFAYVEQLRLARQQKTSKKDTSD